MEKIQNGFKDNDKEFNDKKKILAFWKYAIAKELSPRKQSTLLLNPGTQASSSDNMLKYKVNVNPANLQRASGINSPTEKDVTKKEGTEPGDE